MNVPNPSPKARVNGELVPVDLRESLDELQTIYLRLSDAPHDTRAVQALVAMLGLVNAWLEWSMPRLVVVQRSVVEEYLPQDVVMSEIAETAFGGFSGVLSRGDSRRALEIVDAWGAFLLSLYRLMQSVRLEYPLAVRLAVVPRGALVRFGIHAAARQSSDTVIRVFKVSEDVLRVCEASGSWEDVVGLVDGVESIALEMVRQLDHVAINRGFEMLARVAVSQQEASAGTELGPATVRAIRNITLALLRREESDRGWSYPEWVRLVAGVYGGLSQHRICFLLTHPRLDGAADELYRDVSVAAAKSNSALGKLLVRDIEDVVDALVRRTSLREGEQSSEPEAVRALARLFRLVLARQRVGEAADDSDWLDALTLFGLFCVRERNGVWVHDQVDTFVSRANRVLARGARWGPESSVVVLMRAGVLVVACGAVGMDAAAEEGYRIVERFVAERLRPVATDSVRHYLSSGMRRVIKEAPLDPLSHRWRSLLFSLATPKDISRSAETFSLRVLEAIGKEEA